VELSLGRTRTQWRGRKTRKVVDRNVRRLTPLIHDSRRRRESRTHCRSWPPPNRHASEQRRIAVGNLLTDQSTNGSNGRCESLLPLTFNAALCRLDARRVRVVNILSVEANTAFPTGAPMLWQICARRLLALVPRRAARPQGERDQFILAAKDTEIWAPW